MKKITLIFMIMLLTFSIAHAQWVVDEGFEGTFPSTGWTLESASAKNWVQNNGTSHGPGAAYAGTYAAMYNNYSYSSGSSGLMTTPAFDVSTLTSPQLDFYWWNDDSSYNPAQLLLYSSTDGTTFTLFETIDVYGSGGWVNYNSTLATDVTHVKFEAISDYGMKNTFVDNVKIGLPVNYDVAVDQLTPDATIPEGDSFDYLIKIQNLGLMNDIYDLTGTGGAWTYGIRDKNDTGTISSIAINAGEADTVILRVTAPMSKESSDAETFTATSQGDPSVSANATITTTMYTAFEEFFEDFEECVSPDIPFAWSKIVESTSSAYVKSNSSAPYAHSGNMSVKFYNSGDTSSELFLITPKVISGSNGNRLRFWAKSASTQNFIVGSMTDPTDPSTFTAIETFEVTSNYTVYDYTVNFAKGSGYIAWKHANDGTYDSDYIDDISWFPLLPYNLSIVQLTNDAFVPYEDSFKYLLSIENIGLNNDTYDLTVLGGVWIYEIRDKDDTGTISSIDIAAGVADTVIVRVTAPVAKDVSDTATFTATSQGDPSILGFTDITTTAYAPLSEFFEDFEGCVEPNLPDKWSRIVESTNFLSDVKSFSNATYGHSGDMSIKMYNATDIEAELLLITPALETYVFGNILSFWSRVGYGVQNLILGTITDPTDPTTFTALETFEVTSGYAQFSAMIDLSKSSNYIAFKHGCDGTYDNFYIDDVSWEEVIPEPIMIIDETAHDFGMVDQGTLDTWDVTIFNDGYGTLYINDATVNPPFSVTYPDSIEPLCNDIATVTLDATTVGQYLDVLEFHTNAVQDSTIDLSVIVKGTDYVMEGFEETTFPPFGWENPGDYWARFMSEAYEGQGYARCSWYHDVDAILVSPRLVINGGDFIDFFWRNDNLYEAKGTEVITGDTLWVEISNTYLNLTPTWEVIAVLTADEPMDDYEEAYIAIPDTYIGNNVKIRFRHRSELNSESRGVGLDNVIMPAPYLPVNFSVDPYYASDYVGPGNSVQYTYDVTNLGIQSDRFIILVQDSSAIRYNKRDVEDFETTDGGWVATADWDPVGDWAWTNTYDVANYTGVNVPPPAAHSGTGLWATVPEGDYTNAGGYSFMSKTVDFSDVTDAYMNFWYWSDIFGNFDWCDIVVNSDILLTIDTYNPTNWIYADLDLSAYDGLANVQIVFSFYATTVVEHAGMYIDDLDIPGQGGGPGPGPGTGWPVTVSPPFLELAPGETGSFVATVSIPEDATIDAGQLTPILTYSREDNAVQHQVLVSALCHPKDPYEPNDLMVDSTPAHYDFVSDGAQIYYNPDYRDKDLDIYTMNCLEGDIVWCAFELPEDETEFDGAIKLVDADSTELAFADTYAGGGSEYLQYRILDDGTYYWILGKWNNVLEGKASKKDVVRGENTTYYVVAFDLIPSPEVDVEPLALTLGMIAGTGGTVSDELYISNIAPDALAEDLNWNIQIQIPGVETLYESGFDDAVDWTVSGGTNWSVVSSNNAGGTPPEARFYWSPNVTGLQRIISPVINTTGYTNANLTFKHYVNDYAGGYTIGVATTSDGGTTWNTVWSTIPTGNIGPETYAVTVDNADMGSDQFQLCWFFDGISFDINDWYVDDVKLGVGSPWVSVSPASGSISQGNTQTVTVTCDADTRLEPGEYNADLIVHNDALLYCASDITVPLTFYISDEAGGLQGTVTFNGVPLDSVMVKVGNFVTYTDEYGEYAFDAIASGFFNVLFYKEGFAPYWAYDVYLNPGWTVLLDAELIFDGPVPENLSATGIQEAVDLDWDKPQTGGGGGGTQVDYVLDDGTYENGWAINPGYDVWLGNQFPTTDGGEIISFELYGTANAAAGAETVTIDVFDDGHNLVGTTGSFLIPADDWVTVPAPDIPFTGDFYAMVHWNMLSGNTNYVGFDENGPNANAGYDWYLSAGTWTLLHVAAASTPGVFGIRATAMVRGKNIELAYDTHQLGKEPEVNFHSVDNSAFEKGQRVLDKVFAQSGRTVDTGSYEVSHYTFNGDTELGFKMPRDITLQGYNVYELNKDFVAYVDGENNTSYCDDIVAVGEMYTYWVTAVYDAGESGPSNTDTAIPLAPGGGYHEPFDLNWTTTGWTTAGSPNNWTWAAGYAYLYWSPSVVNYDMSLVSPEIDLPPDPLDVYALTVSMYLDNYSTGDGEVWEIWIIHDGGETLLWSYDDPTANWGVTGGTDWVFTDTAPYAGQSVQLKFRSHGATTFNFNNWYIYDVLFDYAGVPPLYGALEGTVTDGEGIPLEGVAVTANPSDYNPVYTNDIGYYTIDPMAVGFYDVQYYKAGYTEIWYYDVEIEEGITTVLDVALGNPTMDITPTSINAVVPVGGTAIRTITVTNNGNAPLDWGASIENQTELLAMMLENSYTGVIAPSLYTDFDPGQTSYIPPEPSDAMWDILFGYDVDTPSGLTGIAGAECGGGYFYVTKWAGSDIAKFDLAGNWVENFTISGVSGVRDMAYDGTYFYGGAASTTIYKMDFDTHTLAGTISSPVAVRSIAYDSDNDAFWVNNWSEPLKLVDRTGTVLNTITAPPSLYGTAYDNVSDGGPYLWIFTGTTTGGGCQIEQYNLNTLTLTGVTHSVSGDYPATIAGGLFTSEEIVPGKWVIGGLGQAAPDILYGYELCDFASWITIDPTSGTVLPYGGFEEVTVTFDAGDDPAGTIHTCDITFDSPQGVPSVTVPVTLMVGNPEYGDLTGTVTAATGGALIEGAEIIASDDADNTYVTYTNALGIYTIEDMLVGYYTVECTADGYNYQVAVDVPIVVDDITTQDFALTAPIMTVSPLVINTSVDPGTPIQVDITIDNIDGDGPLEWFASIDQPVSIPRASGNHPVGLNAVSAEGVPQGLEPAYGANEPNFTLTRGSIGWGIEAVDGAGCWIDTDAPTVLNNVFVPSFDTYAGEFGPDNDTHMYFCDNTSLNLIYVEMATGTVTTIGPTGLPTYMNDMACDRTTGTMYGIYDNSIYTVNLTTGACTLVGAIGNTGGMMIAIAVDGNGDMWGHDLGTDEIWTIDKATGAGTVKGSTGFDANYAQSMAWDPLANIVYLAAFNNTNLYYELRTVDLSTGATALLGGVYYKEIVAFSFPGETTTPWITIDPTSEVVPAGGTSTLCVFLNTVDYPIGETLFANIEIISDPDVGTVIIPVTVLVSDTVSHGETPVTETSLYANFPNPMLHSTTFNFSLRERSHVKLSVYNVKGQLVDIILDEDLDPCAEHPVVWNGTANGKKLANGIYFYKLETDNKTFLKKMILMK